MLSQWLAGGEDSGSKGSTRCTACTSASFPTTSYRNSKQVVCAYSGLRGRERKWSTIKSQNNWKKNISHWKYRKNKCRKKTAVGEPQSWVKICYIVWCASLDCIVSELFMWEVPKSREQHLNEKVNWWTRYMAKPSSMQLKELKTFILNLNYSLQTFIEPFLCCCSICFKKKLKLQKYNKNSWYENSWETLGNIQMHRKITQVWKGN